VHRLVPCASASGHKSGPEAFIFRIGRSDPTIHGFRASFKTWAGEETGFPRDVIEKALSHVIGNKAEQAYDRGDLFQKRRALMEAWAAFCEGAEASGNVVELIIGGPPN
jgi:integrase